MLRSSALTGFADLAREVGLDPERLADAAGAPREVLTNPDLRIPATVAGQMLADATAMSGVEDFPLRLASRGRLSNWGALALVAREQATLREVVATINRYFALQTEEGRITAVEIGDLVEVRIELIGGGPATPGGQAADIATATVFRNLREVMGQSWTPHCVSFRRVQPRSTAAYRDLFKTKVIFGQAFDGFVCTREDFDRPVPGVDGKLAPSVERYAQDLLKKTVGSLSDRVRSLAVTLLPDQQCKREQVATALGLTVRTLQRRLEEEGATFAGLLDEVRRTLADSYVAGSRRPLQEVSYLLGFANQSAFNHWHRAQYGETPSQRRRKAPA